MGLLLLACLAVGCESTEYEERIYAHRDVETRLFGIWKDGRFSHGVVATPLALLKGVDVRVTGSKEATQPLDDGVTVLADGVYVDGEKREIGDDSTSLFLATEHRLKPIELDDEALTHLHRDSLDDLKQSPVWDRIEQATAEARKAAGGELPEEAGEP